MKEYCYSWNDKMPYGIYKGQILKKIPKAHLAWIRDIVNSSDTLKEKDESFAEFLNTRLSPF